MSLARSWGDATACYHEPSVHDHELYFQLANMNLYLLLPIAVAGLFFNASALICLHRPPKITSGVLVYLKALLILDHCQLVITTATVMLPQICDVHHSRNHTLYGLCMFERRFLRHTIPRVETTVNTIHVWTLAALSAHRYWKISRPVESRLKDTVARAHMFLVTLLALALSFRSPIFLYELQISWAPRLRIGRRWEATEIMTPYRLIYHSVLDPVLSNLVPFVWMSIFSLLTLYEIFRSRDFTYKQISFEGSTRSNKQRGSVSQPLKPGLRKKSEAVRVKQELRATISIVLIILLYLLLHSLHLYTLARKWQLLLSHECPTRRDYIQSQVGTVLSMVSATVNAFVFIAFTNRLRKYVQLLLRKTSRTLSNSSEPPLSPKTTTTVEVIQHHCIDTTL